MKTVTFTGCRHVGEVDDATPTVMGKQVMDICPRCKAVTTVDDLFVGYPCGYYTQYGKGVLAAVKEINGDAIIVATSNAKSSLTYEEWTVSKGDFRKKGLLLVADPFGTAVK